MADWKKVHSEKMRSMDDAIRALPKNAAIIMGMASMESQGFMSRIHEFADHFEYLKVLSCLNMNSYQFCEDPQYEGRFMNENWFFWTLQPAGREEGYRLVDFYSQQPAPGRRKQAPGPKGPGGDHRLLGPGGSHAGCHGILQPGLVQRLRGRSHRGGGHRRPGGE
jgi:hypothetical protein